MTTLVLLRWWLFVRIILGSSTFMPSWPLDCTVESRSARDRAELWQHDRARIPKQGSLVLRFLGCPRMVRILSGKVSYDIYL